MNESYNKCVQVFNCIQKQISIRLEDQKQTIGEEFQQNSCSNICLLRAKIEVWFEH